jgi:hypothetical protein
LTLSNYGGQIVRFVELNELPADPLNSIAIDAIPLTPDRSCIPAKGSDYAFVVYSQPWEWKFKCLPLHVIQGDSEEADAEIRALISTICDCLAEQGLELKYICTDSESG